MNQNKVNFIGLCDPKLIMLKDGPCSKKKPEREDELQIKNFFLSERRMMRKMKKLQICPKEACCINNFQKYFSTRRNKKPKRHGTSMNTKDYYKFLLKYSPNTLQDLNVGNMKISYKKYLIDPFAPNRKCTFIRAPKKKKLKPCCRDYTKLPCAKSCKAKPTSSKTKKPCFFSLQGLYENYNQYQQNIRCGDLCKAGPAIRQKKVRFSSSFYTGQ